MARARCTSSSAVRSSCSDTSSRYSPTVSPELEPRSNGCLALVALSKARSSIPGQPLWKTYRPWRNLATDLAHNAGVELRFTNVTRRTQFRLLVALSLVWIAWSVWSLLGQSHPYELRVLDDAGVPVASAVVDIAGSQAGTTDSAGSLELRWDRSSRVLTVSAPGHVPQTITLSDRPEQRFDVVLRAQVLRGQVSDEDGQGLGEVFVDAGGVSGVTDPQGRFELRGAESGEVVVSRPAWLEHRFDWDGGAGEMEVTLRPFTARAVHIGGENVRDEFETFVEMALDTELNSLMIDLKDESGRVFYETSNVVAESSGAAVRAYSLNDVVQEAHQLGLYVIGRIVLFNDPIVSRSHPEMAVWDADLNGPYQANGQYFLDPTDPDARAYGLDLAIEACRLGVDEVQFDYIRFPDSRRESATFDGGVTPDVRLSTVTGFLKDAVAELRPLRCAVAADIFGYLTTATDDGGIGQRWEEISGIVDVVSPMLYPSHYDSGWWFDEPNEHPGDVIREALEDGMARMTSRAIVRPWLQDFGYEANQVRAQIESAEGFGLGWMLWNAQSRVTTQALRSVE